MHHTGSNSLEMVVDGAEEPSACAPVAVDSPLPAVQKPPGTVKPIKRIATLLKENADLVLAASTILLFIFAHVYLCRAPSMKSNKIAY